MSSDDSGTDVRDRIETGAQQVDARLVDLLSWVMDTETRARIYIALRERPGQTSDEVAEETGLYPSTVREALAALHDDGMVTRRKRSAAGAGNNPYEYEAIPPSELVAGVAEDVQAELNTVFNLDEALGGEESRAESERGPVTISVAEEDEE